MLTSKDDLIYSYSLEIPDCHLLMPCLQVKLIEGNCQNNTLIKKQF